MLSMLKAIERDFGRRRGQRWGARVIDLDIILWSGGRWRSPGLIVPHSAYAARDFVLHPLATIAAEQARQDRIEQAGLELLAPVEANGVFVEIPVPVQAALRDKGWRFYTFLGETGCRLMCAWDTAPETVDRFLADLEASQRAAAAR